MYKEISLDEVRKYQIEVLNTVVDFCDREGLKYFLTGGTLIGAIRHQGYIPWDDDIDISMLREDYERFLKLFPEDHPSLWLYCTERVPNSIYPFVKICKRDTLFHEEAFNDGVNLGVNIDLFPIDAVRENKADTTLRQVATLRSMGTRKAVKYQAYQGNIAAKVLKCLYHKALDFLPFATIYKWLNKVILNAEKGNGRLLKGIVIWGYGKRELVAPDIFEETTLVPFEGGQYTAPKAYDQWLRSIYGDYMQLPPIEKQVSQHPHTRAYIKS